jgi:hypothetical protein
MAVEVSFLEMFADSVQTLKADLSFALRFLSVARVTIHRIARQARVVEEFDNRVRGGDARAR